MDDSMDAFQLPSLTMRKQLSVVRRKQESVSSNTINVENNIKTQGTQQQQENTDEKKIKLQDIYSTLEGNSTLSDISDIKDEIFNDICSQSSPQQIKAGNDKKSICSDPVSQNRIRQIEGCLKHISSGGSCKLCTMVIPKDMRQMHHLQCLQNKYSYKNIKIQLQSKSTCTLCKQEINISLYESHFTKCKQINSQVAETVTSSYFQPPVLNMQTPITKKKILCPTCSLDLSGQNITAKQSHVNRCLDSSIDKPSLKVKTTSQKSILKCQQCGKTFKTKANLSRHIQSCSACNDLNSSDATKFRDESLKARRKYHNQTARNQEEEFIKIAKAISKSEADEEKRKKKQEKLKCKEQAVPVMLQETTQSRKLALEDKFVKIISHPIKDDLGDYDVPSTPVLPITSKWSKRSGQVSNQSIGENHLDVLDQTFNNRCAVIGDKLESSLCKETNVTSSPETGVCKWQLTGGSAWQQPSTASTYQVTGLLSQFENTSSGLNKIRATPASQCTADQQTKIIEVQQSKDNSDQTLNQLKDLDQSIDQETKELSYICNADNFTVTGVENCYSLNNVQDTQSLQCDMKCLVNCRSFSDITLQIFDELGKVHDIFAHKCIIFARFPNFLRILEEGVCKKGVYKVTQCTQAELMPLLTYIYTGSLEGSSKIEINAILLKFGTTLRSSGKYHVNFSNVCSINALFENDICTLPKSESTNVASEDDRFFNPVSPEPLNFDRESQCLLNGCLMDSQEFVCAKAVPMNEVTSPSQFNNLRPPMENFPTAQQDSERTRNKRGLVDFTPLADNRLSKVRRMTGSTPKSPPVVIYQLPVDTPVDICDVSSIVAFSPSSSPTLKGKVRGNSLEVTNLSHVRESGFEFKQGNCVLYDTSLTQPVNKSEKDNQEINAISNAVSKYSNTFDIQSNKKSNEPGIFQLKDERHISNHGISQTTENTLSNVELSKNCTIQPSPYKPDQHYETDKCANHLWNLSHSNDTAGQNCVFSESCANKSALFSAAVNQVVPSDHIFQTPTSRKNPNQSYGDTPLTPMPGYSDMDTPEIVKQGQTIGLKRTLGKKKLKIKLKEMYAYRHQVGSSSDEEETAASSVSRTYTNKDRIERMKAEKQTNEAIRVLEQYPLQDFRNLLARSLAAIYQKGILLRALRKAKQEGAGIARGSRMDIQRWLNNLTPTSPSYNPQVAVLMSLSSAKQQVIIECLSSMVVNHEDVRQFQPYMFNILPTIYRVMNRLDHKVLPLQRDNAQ